MTKKKPKKLTDVEREARYSRASASQALRWPYITVLNAYLAGLKAGRKESKKC